MSYLQKSIDKDEKSGEKIINIFNKDLENMKAKILAVLNEDFWKESAERDIDQFIKSVGSLGKEIMLDNPEEKKLLMDKNTSIDELSKLGDESISQRLELLDDVAKLHGQIKVLSTENEWKQISKWINIQAQDQIFTDTLTNNVIENIYKKEPETVKKDSTKRTSFNGYPYVFYTPETKLAFGAGANHQGIPYCFINQTNNYFFIGTRGFTLFSGLYDHLKLDCDDQFIRISGIGIHWN